MDNISLGVVVFLILLLLFTLSSKKANNSEMEGWRGSRGGQEYNPVGRGPRGGWDNRSYRSRIQPISYSGWGPYYAPVHRYIPVFDSKESDNGLVNCIEACSTKNGEDYQECLKLCKETYPSFSVV
jgi:hypothetical protein